MFEYDGKKHQRLVSRSEQLRAVNFDLAQRLTERQLQVRELERDGVEISKAQLESLRGWKSDIEFLKNELAAVQQKLHDLSPAVSAIESWLSNNRTHPDYGRPQERAPKNPSRTRELLTKVRSEIAALTQKRETVIGAPLPKVEAAQRINAMVDQLAGECRGLPTLAASAAVPWTTIEVGTFSLRGNSSVDAHGGVQLAVAAGPLLCWLLGDTIKQRLIESLPADAGSIPMADRPAQIAKLDAALQPLAADEESLASQLEVAGEAVARRPDADPALILGAKEVADPPDTHWEPSVQQARGPVHSQYLREVHPSAVND